VKQEVEKSYATADVVAKLRRLASALEAGKPLEMYIAGKRIYVPSNATVTFEYEHDGDEAEVEIELRWKPRRKSRERSAQVPGTSPD